MAENINQLIELANIGVAVAALFAGAWVVLLLAAIAVRALVRQLGLDRADSDERNTASARTRRSRTTDSARNRNRTVSEVTS